MLTRQIFKTTWALTKQFVLYANYWVLFWSNIIEHYFKVYYWSLFISFKLLHELPIEKTRQENYFVEQIQLNCLNIYKLFWFTLF